MSDVKRLLAEATPLPWELYRYENGTGRFFVGNRLVADVYHEGDRDLIAHLPDYEAAADALEHFVESWGGNYDDASRNKDTEDSYRLARAALRRLRDEVPA